MEVFEAVEVVVIRLEVEEVVVIRLEAVALAGLEEAEEFAGLGVSANGLTATTPIQLLDQILQMIKPLKRLGREAIKLSTFTCNQR